MSNKTVLEYAEESLNDAIDYKDGKEKQLVCLQEEIRLIMGEIMDAEEEIKVWGNFIAKEKL